jgi:hypothetical protein
MKRWIGFEDVIQVFEKHGARSGRKAGPPNACREEREEFSVHPPSLERLQELEQSQNPTLPASSTVLLIQWSF